jgi:hypothetical protein
VSASRSAPRCTEPRPAPRSGQFSPSASMRKRSCLASRSATPTSRSTAGVSFTGWPLPAPLAWRRWHLHRRLRSWVHRRPGRRRRRRVVPRLQPGPGRRPGARPQRSGQQYARCGGHAEQVAPVHHRLGVRPRVRSDVQRRQPYVARRRRTPEVTPRRCPQPRLESNRQIRSLQPRVHPVPSGTRNVQDSRRWRPAVAALGDGSRHLRVAAVDT